MTFFGPPIRNGVPIGLGSSIGFGSAPFTPAELFYAGEQGFWYDPTDIPLAWRRNLLTYTEQFDNAAWNKYASTTVTANAGVAPDGTTTADLVYPTTTGSLRGAYQGVSIAAGTYTESIYVKASGKNFVAFYDFEGSLYAGSVDLTNGSTASVKAGYTITPVNVGSGWWRISITAATTAGTRYLTFIVVDAAGGTTVTTNGIDGILVWGAQLELGSTASTYQQIVTPEISFLQYQSQPVLYTDSAGTTPVTAVEQAVGLMLDKSKGLVLGPELGASLNSAGSWTAYGSNTVVGSGGEITITFVGGVNSAFGAFANTSSLGLTVGRRYLFEFEVKINTGSATPYINDGVANISFSASSTTYEKKSCRFLYSGAGVIQINNDLSAGEVITFRGFSVRELPGNHAYQSTSASRPTLRARYNLLTRTEEFNDAVWIKAAGGVGVLPVVTANAGTAPDGTLTADRIQFDCGNTSSATNRSRIQQAVTLTLGQAHTGRIWIKAYDVSNVGKTVRFVIESNSNEIIHTLTADWVAVSLPGTATNTAGNFLFETRGLYTQQTADVLVWGAQFTQPAVFPSNTYQRIGAATDYATGAAFPPYLAFDGVDDSLLTNSVDFATVTSDGQARRNLLNNPTQFDVTTSWSVASLSVTANNTTAPDGTATAELITLGAGTAKKWIGQVVSAFSGARTYSFYAKYGTNQFVQLLNNGTVEGFANFDIQNGVAGTKGSGVTSSITDAGNGWWRCVVTHSIAAATEFRIYGVDSNSAGWDSTTTSTGTYFLWGAQLETGSSATAFQNIGTDKMLVVAGVTKNSDAAWATIAEFSASSGGNNGTFALFAPGFTPATEKYLWRSGGSVLGSAAFTSSASFNAPVTNVVAGVGEIATDTCVLRANGSQVGTSAADQGTGNFGSYPLFIGRRNNASLPLNGNIYSLVIAGAAYSAGQISSTESWVAAKTPLGTI